MMTLDDLLSNISARGGAIAPHSEPQTIAVANATLQHIGCAMLPAAFGALYAAAGGAVLNTGYVFGPNEFDNAGKYPVPSLVTFNASLPKIPALHGRTIFGRNDLFWFAFDAFGTCYMLENLRLQELRKYDDPYRAVLDCLVSGKI